MKNIFRQQSQFELFPGAHGAKPQRHKSFIFGRSLTLSFENLVVVFIAVLMALIVAFSFGVERGQHSADKGVSQGKKAQRPDHAQVIGVTSTNINTKEEKVQAVEIPEKVEGPAATETAAESTKGATIEKKVDKTSSLEKIHTIQVASFRQKDRAQKEADNLKSKNYDAFIAPKGAYYIVCVGRFKGAAQARSLLHELRIKYSDCFIRSL